MTFQISADQDMALRIEANLYKLVNVLSIEDITEKQSVIRELALIKVNVRREDRAEVLQLFEVFRARAVDVGDTTLIAEITGKQDKIEALVGALRPFGIVEMVQSGTVAMSRGGEGDAARAAKQSNVRGVAAA
jgi:acetolactate synthase-1/3 small subunit